MFSPISMLTSSSGRNRTDIGTIGIIFLRFTGQLLVSTHVTHRRGTDSLDADLLSDDSLAEDAYTNPNCNFS